MKDLEESIHLQIAEALSGAYYHLQQAIAESLANQNAPSAGLSEANELLFRLDDALLSNAKKDAEGLTEKLEQLTGIVEGTMQSLYAAKKHPPGYQTGSFRCKSDCDKCLDSATSITEKCLCLALFTRCILKG